MDPNKPQRSTNAPGTSGTGKPSVTKTTAAKTTAAQATPTPAKRTVATSTPTASSTPTSSTATSSTSATSNRNSATRTLATRPAPTTATNNAQSAGRKTVVPTTAAAEGSARAQPRAAGVTKNTNANASTSGANAPTGTAGPKKAVAKTEGDTSLAHERYIAELAVQRVVLMTDKLFKVLDARNKAQGKGAGKGAMGQHKAGASGENTTTMAKADDSPVTIADYAAQALLIYAMRKAFPNYGFLGEEDTKDLRTKPRSLAEVVRLVEETRLADPALDELLGRPQGEKELLATIDLGASTSTAEPGKRYIVMDPIDGTSAFLQSGQYAVVLGIVENGREILGVAAGPNIKFGDVVQRGATIREHDIDDGLGTMISAVRGHGATARPVGPGGLLPAVPLNRTSQPPPKIDQRKAGLAKFHGLQYIDSKDSPKSRWDKVKDFAGDYESVVQLYSSHVRYMAMALGDRSYVQIRWPDERKKKFKPWAIWDHVGTPLIYSESGRGKVTDLHGKTLSYDEGRDMVSYYGIITADATIHKAILDAVKVEYAVGKAAAGKK